MQKSGTLINKIYMTSLATILLQNSFNSYQILFCLDHVTFEELNKNTSSVYFIIVCHLLYPKYKLEHNLNKEDGVGRKFYSLN